MYSPLLYNKRDTSPIQYTKNINGMASLVDAIRKILEKYNTLHVKHLTERKEKN